jgi:hypothetical protein
MAGGNDRRSDEDVHQDQINNRYFYGFLQEAHEHSPLGVAMFRQAFGDRLGCASGALETSVVSRFRS